jgi:hypothetical protein
MKLNRNLSRPCLLVGLIVGTFAGMFTAALMAASARGDKAVTR